jgi:hypothetical protein
MELAAGIQPAPGLVVVSIGGDGTAHEVINGLAYGGLMRQQAAPDRASPVIPPLGIIPCGSGNTVAYSIGIDSVEGALACIAAGHWRAMDVIEMTHPDDTAVPLLKGHEPAADAAPGAAAAATSAAAAAPDAATAVAAQPSFGETWTLPDLRQRVMYSVNMIGWAFSTAVLATADSLRWCGGAQYNCAAYAEVRACVRAAGAWVTGAGWRRRSS